MIYLFNHDAPVGMGGNVEQTQIKVDIGCILSALFTNFRNNIYIYRYYNKYHQYGTFGPLAIFLLMSLIGEVF